MTPPAPTIALLEAVVKGIRLGPTLPAFVTPALLQILVDDYDIKPIGTAEEDLNEIPGRPIGTAEEDLDEILRAQAA